MSTPTSPLTGFTTLLRRFRRDDSGVFAVFFGVLALVLFAIAGAVVDFTSMQEARTRAQTAIDSAALALQNRIAVDTNSTLVSKAQSILTSQMADTSVTATVTNVSSSTADGTIAITASVTVPTAFVRMVGISSLSANLLSEVTKGSKNVEVAVSLDITGSMAGQKIADLQAATNTLIDLVVQDLQTPTYSKMAIIPWSNSMNASSYAANVRGPVQGPINITDVGWQSASLDITGITRANPAVVTTASAHGLSTGDTVYISGVSGMTQVNNRTFTVTYVSTTQFKLNSTNSSSYSAYVASGTDLASKCIVSTCNLVITTASAHGMVAGERVYVAGVGGTTTANNTAVSSPSTIGVVPGTTSFSLSGVAGPGSGAYSGGGTAQCLHLGCEWYRFTSPGGSTVTRQVSTCVSERTTNAFDDTAPATSYLGYVYPGTSNSACPSATLMPLSTSKTDLHNKVASLTASGYTAGHIGLAWGWYMVSPNFASLWPTASQPAAYNSSNLIKAVVLMTDGDFNTQYCNGVIDQDSAAPAINCSSPNGSSGAQFDTLCSNIKAQNILLYTVGFDLAGNATALSRLQSCATDNAHFFQADTGADLATAFTQIAQSLNSLRVSK